MNDEIDRLFAQVHGIEAQIERRLDEQREQFRYRVAKGRAVFEAEARQLHRTLRASLLRYLWETPWRHLLVAPVIYAMVVPFALLDLSLTAYQHICFRAWGIGRVARRDYIVLDRHRLGYLNAIERLNCLYCSYANGLLGYAREIAGRTEQFWCPIRHATAIRGPHAHYKAFVNYGDAEGYRTRLEELRGKLR
jgi:hypothetical protein